MKQDALKQPFFATLLESQKRTPEPDSQYIPWPRPKPTYPSIDHDQTHKYPSDNDEEGTQI
jgi:hypothetical protein